MCLGNHNEKHGERALPLRGQSDKTGSPKIIHTKPKKCIFFKNKSSLSTSLYIHFIHTELIRGKLFFIIQIPCSDYFCVGSSLCFCKFNRCLWQLGIISKTKNLAPTCLSQRVVDHCRAMRSLIWNMGNSNLIMKLPAPHPPNALLRQDSLFITLYNRVHVIVWNRNNSLIPRVLEHTSTSQKHRLLDLLYLEIRLRKSAGGQEFAFLTVLSDACVKSPEATC